MELLELCRQIIATADPSVRLDSLSPKDVATEALAIAQFTTEYWRKHQELKQDSSSTLLLVPESVLTQYGVPIQDLELTTYDSNPAPARFDAFPVVRHKVGFQGLKIAVTHKAGEDHRFGKPMLVSYGHLERSYGEGDDGQSHDFFVGHDPESEKLFAIQQLKPDGTKDERKFGVHFSDPQSFKESYQAQLPNDLKDKLFGGVWEADINQLQKYRADAYHADSCGCEVCETKQKQKDAIAQVGKKRRKPKPVEAKESDRADAAKMTRVEANFNDEDNGKPCNSCKNWLGADKIQPTDGETVRDEHIPVGHCRLVEGALWELASCDHWEVSKGDRTDADDKYSKEETNYSEDEPIDQGLCGECVYYQPVDGNFGTCSLVEGKIWQLGHCDEFVEGDGYAGFSDRADADETTKPYLIWFGGRRTPIAVRAEGHSQAITKAKQLKRRGGDAVTKIRQATAGEQKTAASGAWIRTGPNGEKPGYNPGKRGHGPPVKKDAGELATDEESDRADAEGGGEPCGDGWISPGEECRAGRSSGRGIRIQPSYDSGYLLFKPMKLGDAKYDGVPNPERTIAKKFYGHGLDSNLEPAQLELLRKNPKALVSSIENWDRGARSLLQAAHTREEQYRAGTLADPAQRFGARQIEALGNSVEINGIMRREFIAAITGDKTDPYISGNALYGFRFVKDKRGNTQNIANVAYLPSGATRIFLMVTAPQNLSVNGIWKPYYGEDNRAIAKLEAQRMPGSSTSMLEGLIRENLAKGGTGQMECAPLDLNKPLFQRAGFREAEDDEFILSPEAAQKFLEMRDRIHAKKDSAMDDIEAQQWQKDLNDLEEELGGMMVLPKQKSKADADDQDLADWLTDRAQGETATVFQQWADAIQSWFGSSDSIEAIQQSLTEQPAKCYDQLSPDPLEDLLYQFMMLADLGGRLDGQTESLEREDAAKPSWLKLPFKEAIAFLRQKVTIPTNSYVKMSEGYHGWAFSVARMTKASMVDDAKWVVEKGLTEGYGYDRLIKMWDRLIGRKGWQASGSRVYTILDTNIRSAYSAGRAQQVFDPDLQGDDVIVWRHRDSRVPRPLHLALHDKAIAASDPFWQIAFPSCGYGCKCSAFRTSRGYAERNSIEVLSKAPDPNTIADPGFRFNRAGVSEGDRQAIIDSTLDTLPPGLRKKVEADLQKQ